jgi:hypothetical protein
VTGSGAKEKTRIRRYSSDVAFFAGVVDEDNNISTAGVKEMLLNYGARCGRKVRNDEDSLKARAAGGQGFLSLRVLCRPHEGQGLSSAETLDGKQAG